MGIQAMACKGVDLTHPRWLIAPANRDDLRTAQDFRLWPTESIHDVDPSFWGKMEGMLALGDLGSDAPDVQEESIRPAFGRMRSLVSAKVSGLDRLNDLRVAVAFPFRAPPIVRKELHHLFTDKFLSDTKKPMRSAIEAPIALAIECVARDLVDLSSPASLLLLTGGPSSLELTAATLTRAGTTLGIEVTACVAIDPDDPDSLRRHRESLPIGRLHHAVEDDGGLGLGSDVVELGPSAVAIGAVRHAGLLDQQFWMGAGANRGINGIKVARPAPMAVGVLGTNDEGDWFWRRVVERNAKLSTSPVFAGLALGEVAPDRIALVECPDPDLSGRLWLSRRAAPDGPREEWAGAALRWHEIISNREKVEDWDLQVRIRADPGHWHHLPYQSWRVVDGEKARAAVPAEPKVAGGP